MAAVAIQFTVMKYPILGHRYYRLPVQRCTRPGEVVEQILGWEVLARFSKEGSPELFFEGVYP